ncbi:MAG: replication-associated recombination protein A [Candidatus Dadabacteria bacterium]|nr:replication-associated recombination protein A [Candidatus Dadabacteria bacterium]MDE0663939.1 replication-associated recombination protein A [Candidatus Dadabacteria bacterium]
MRPESMQEMVGQEHLIGPQGLVTKTLEAGGVHSMIFWGPPGTGKTTLSRLIAGRAGARFIQINAISSGVRELRDIVADARDALYSGRKTVLFIDEIHRFNKAQQAALLKSVEEGVLVLIGATTENPSFEVISPLLSRCQVYVLDPLSAQDLELILEKAFSEEKLLEDADISTEARGELIALCGGDARVMLNALEIASSLVRSKKLSRIDTDLVREIFQKTGLLYDRAGEEHYNTISAFIKSVRGSDPDAAVYYLARMLEAGEDPKFIARRLVILASEDIGNAEPYALTLATDCFTAVNYVGMPESRIILSQVTTYLASCPKSNAAYRAIKKAESDVRKNPGLQIPLHLRNAPTKLMKDLGYKKGYKYAHDYEDHFVEDDFLPEEIKDSVYYEPTDKGREANLKKYLEARWKKRKK